MGKQLVSQQIPAESEGGLGWCSTSAIALIWDGYIERVAGAKGPFSRRRNGAGRYRPRENCDRAIPRCSYLFDQRRFVTSEWLRNVSGNAFKGPIAMRGYPEIWKAPAIYRYVEKWGFPNSYSDGPPISGVFRVLGHRNCVSDYLEFRG